MSRIGGAEHFAREYVRTSYGVPADFGMRVRVDGRAGIIVGFHNAYLRVKFDNGGAVLPCHPSWRTEYIDDAGEVIHRGEGFPEVAHA